MNALQVLGRLDSRARPATGQILHSSRDLTDTNVWENWCFQVNVQLDFNTILILIDVFLVECFMRNT